MNISNYSYPGPVDLPLFKALVEGAFEGIMVLKACRNHDEEITDFQYVFANEKAREIFGLKGMTGKKMSEIFPRHLENGLFRKYVEVMETQVQADMEIFLQGKVQGWTNIKVAPINDGIFLSLENINGRKTESLALEKKIEQFQNFVENLPSAAFHRTGNTLILNKKAEEITGYTRTEIPDVETWFRLVHRQDVEWARELYETGRRQNFKQVQEMPVWRKSGEQIWVSFSAHIYDGGEVILMQDITAEKAAKKKLEEYSAELEQRVSDRTDALSQAISRLEQEIRERINMEKALISSQKETERALLKERELNVLKSRFVSMASHEFRTPLSTILTSVSLIGRYHDPSFLEKRVKHIDRIRSNVKNLTTILNDFLSLSKLEEGKVEAEAEEIKLPTFIRELIDELSSLAKPGQTISHIHHGDKDTFFLDPNLLRNILINLCSNAIKYSGNNSEVKLVSTSSPSGLKIDIIDQGIGIPYQDQKYMFTRFFRAGNATNIKGTGLGLTIVKRYLDLINGKISFVSTLGEGSTFTIHFPDVSPD